MATTLDSGVRPTVAEVKEVFDTEITSGDGTIEAFMNSAHRVVDDVLSGETVSEGTKTDLEKYLAAHFTTAIDPRAIQESVGDADFRYQRVKDSDESEYLDIVRTLDPTGKVAQAVSGQPAATLQAYGPGRD